MKHITWAGLVLLATTPAFAQTVPNGSFENPVVGSGYVYNPTGIAGITFNAGSGVQGNGSAWGFDNAPDGVQSAFIQSGSDFTGAISFDLTGLTAGSIYSIAFDSSARPQYTANPFTIAINNTTLNAFTVLQNSWQSYTTSSFTAIGNTATLTFAGSPTTTGDNDVGLDNVRLIAAGGAGAVPEPATWAMMLVGFGMIGFGLRRRSKITTSIKFA